MITKTQAAIWDYMTSMRPPWYMLTGINVTPKGWKKRIKTIPKHDRWWVRDTGAIKYYHETGGKSPFQGDVTYD